MQMKRKLRMTCCAVLVASLVPVTSSLLPGLFSTAALAGTYGETIGGGSAVFLDEGAADLLHQQIAQAQQAAIDAAERCDQAGLDRAREELRKFKDLAQASTTETQNKIAEMTAQLKAILEQLAKFLPQGDPNKPALKSAQGALTGLIEEGALASITSGATEAGKAAAKTALGPVKGALDSINSVIDDIDKMGEGSRILDTANDQMVNIQQARLSLIRWNDVYEHARGVLNDAPTVARTDCGDDEDDNNVSMGGYDGSPFENAFVLIGSDGTKWCTYTPGTRTRVPLLPSTTDPDDPDDGGGSDDPASGGGSSGGSTTQSGDDDDDWTLVDDDEEYSSDGSSVAGGGPCDELTRLWERVHEIEVEFNQHPEDAVGPLQPLFRQISKVEKLCVKQREASGSGTATAVGGGDETVAEPETTTTREDESTTDETDEPETPITVTIYVKAKTSVMLGDSPSTTIPRRQVKLYDPSTVDVALPGADAVRDQSGFDADPVQGTTDDAGNLVLIGPGSMFGIPADTLTSTPAGYSPTFEIAVDASEQGSHNIRVGGGLTPTEAMVLLPEDLVALVTGVTSIGESTFITVGYAVDMQGHVISLMDSMGSGVTYQINYCRDEQASANDPYFAGAGSWEQTYDDQWAIKRVGLKDGAGSAWDMLGPDPQPVTIAVIDTGLDWNHLDFSWSNIWTNGGEIPDNGIDDDGNGFVDDIIGWNFYDQSNNPWDHNGHGTIVSGIIAADHNNGIGIAGINPHARIMVLRALNSFGHSRASYLAAAIVYAADNGARIINMSVGGKETTDIETEAVEYARKKGVLIIAASGNEGINVDEWGIAGLDNVITVAATGMDDKRTIFSNWGRAVDIAAPGMDILSLRARRTDTMLDIPGVKYVAGAAYVGIDKRYYRASGTSFSAPIVAGVASLLLSKDPSLTPDEVRRMLLNSARDIDIAGVDQYSGYGLVDARAALATDKAFYIDARINGVEVANASDGTVVRVLGTADADKLKSVVVEIGAGEDPQSWKTVVTAPGKSVHEGAIGDIPAASFAGSPTWQIRLVVNHKNGVSREARFQLDLQ